MPQKKKRIAASGLRPPRNDKFLRVIFHIEILALLLGIDQRVYSNYELGKRALPLRHLVTLAEYYHVSTDYLLGLTDHIRPYPKGRTK